MSLPNTSFHHLAIQSRESRKIAALLQRRAWHEGSRIDPTSQQNRAFYRHGGTDRLIELFSPPLEGEADLPDYDNGKLVLYHFCLAVDDVAAAIEHCRQAGCSIKKEAFDLKLEDGFEATIGFVWGPNGESVEFINQKSSW